MFIAAADPFAPVYTGPQLPRRPPPSPDRFPLHGPDGLLDWWEIQHGPDAGFWDPDADALRDAEELTQGSDPHNFDTDADGFADGYDPDPVHYDADGDGVND